MLKTTQVFNRYEMCVPPVFTAEDNIVVPSKYEDMIPSDGTLAAMWGRMKCGMEIFSVLCPDY